MDTIGGNPTVTPETDAGRVNKPELHLTPEAGKDENRIASVMIIRDEQEVSGEISLPDYYADAEKILFITAAPHITEGYFDDGVIKYSGNVTFTAYFLTSENELQSISFDSEFEGRAQPEEAGYSDDAEYSLSIIPLCTPAVCRLTGPRRLTAKCRLTPQLRAVKQELATVSVVGDGAAGITLQKKSDTADSLCCVTMKEEDISFSDDIEIEGSTPQLTEVITCSVNIVPDECKLSGDAVHLRGSACVNCLCRTEDGGIMTVFKKFPISESFDIPDGVPTEGDVSAEAFADVTSVRTTVSENSFGEKRIIELDLAYSVSFCLSGCKKSRMTRDIYSTEYATDPGYQTYEACHGCRTETANFSVNASEKFRSESEDAVLPSGTESRENDIPAERPRIPRAPSVLYADATVGEINADFDEQRGRIVATGSAEVHMIVGDEGRLRGITFSVPLKSELDGYGIKGKVITCATAYCQSVHGRADTGAVYADFEVFMNVSVYSVSDEKLIGRLTVDREKAFDPMSRPPILIYYPHRGESLWDIAKKYCTTVGALREINHLDGDTAVCDSVMLIPRQIGNTEKK